jgi:hypothetical protein
VPQRPSSRRRCDPCPWSLLLLCLLLLQVSPPAFLSAPEDRCRLPRTPPRHSSPGAGRDMTPSFIKGGRPEIDCASDLLCPPLFPSPFLWYWRGDLPPPPANSPTAAWCRQVCEVISALSRPLAESASAESTIGRVYHRQSRPSAEPAIGRVGHRQRRPSAESAVGRVDQRQSRLSAESDLGRVGHRQSLPSAESSSYPPQRRSGP